MRAASIFRPLSFFTIPFDPFPVLTNPWATLDYVHHQPTSKAIVSHPKSATTSTSPLPVLTHAIIKKILSYLRLPDLVRASMVATFLNTLALEERIDRRISAGIPRSYSYYSHVYCNKSSLSKQERYLAGTGTSTTRCLDLYPDGRYEYFYEVIEDFTVTKSPRCSVQKASGRWELDDMKKIQIFGRGVKLDGECVDVEQEREKKDWMHIDEMDPQELASSWTSCPIKDSPSDCKY